MTAASYWLLSLLLLFCKSNLGIVLTEREEVLNDPEQDPEGEVLDDLLERLRNA